MFFLFRKYVVPLTSACETDIHVCFRVHSDLPLHIPGILRKPGLLAYRSSSSTPTASSTMEQVLCERTPRGLCPICSLPAWVGVPITRRSTSTPSTTPTWPELWSGLLPTVALDSGNTLGVVSSALNRRDQLLRSEGWSSYREMECWRMGD